MNKKKISLLVVTALVALLEFGDFVGNATTAVSSTAFDDARSALGVSVPHQWLRLVFLVPVSAIITVLAGGAFFAALRDRYQMVHRLRVPLGASLAALGVFHIVATGLVAGSTFALFGLIYLILASTVFRLLQ